MWIKDIVLTKKEQVSFSFCQNYSLGCRCVSRVKKSLYFILKIGCNCCSCTKPWNVLLFDWFFAPISSFLLKSSHCPGCTPFSVSAYSSQIGILFFWYTIEHVHLCLIASEKRGQPLLFSDIRLQWEPDVFSDDMKLKSMALTAHSRDAGINSFRLSMSGVWNRRLLTFYRPVPASSHTSCNWWQFTCRFHFPGAFVHHI